MPSSRPAGAASPKRGGRKSSGKVGKSGSGVGSPRSNPGRRRKSARARASASGSTSASIPASASTPASAPTSAPSRTPFGLTLGPNELAELGLEEQALEREIEAAIARERAHERAQEFSAAATFRLVRELTSLEKLDARDVIELFASAADQEGLLDRTSFDKLFHFLVDVTHAESDPMTQSDGACSI